MFSFFLFPSFLFFKEYINGSINLIYICFRQSKEFQTNLACFNHSRKYQFSTPESSFLFKFMSMPVV